METGNHLRLALVQTDLFWEDIPANLASLEEKIAAHETGADVIILPEMFSTGFSMEPEKLAEPLNLVTTRWMRQVALNTGALTIGSFIARDGARFFNRLMAVAPDGQYQYYDKRHLFRMSGENDIYTAGNELITVEWKGWKIRPLVCYDLRFPVWSRNSGTDPYDLLVYVANWPAARSFAWDTLLKARAIENLSYVAGVNRVGADNKGADHAGGSVVLDFLGQEMLNLKAESRIDTVDLSLQSLQDYRARFPAYLDADQFKITNC